MFEIAALFAAIFMLIIVLQLRAVLANIFPLYHAKIVQIEPPKSIADLYQSMNIELQQAGFEGPVWLLIENVPVEANSSPICAVYRHPDSQILAWNMMPMNIARPNQLNQFYTTILEDGRVVTSQVYDVYFDAVSCDQAPAQTLYTEDVPLQIKMHRSFVASFDSPPLPESISNEQIIRLAGEHMNQQRSRLLKSGLLWQDASGIVRPKLRFALRLLKAVWLAKKSKLPPAPVPAERLTLFATYLERVRHMEPSLRIQIGLFSFSIVLSAIVGAIIWNVQFAIVLLVVVIFHELGHYSAMRMFGYKNVHMMALPLVGGVTIGFDTKPNAWRRAWMSLMGPLPGIIVGWLLLFYLLNMNVPDEQIEWFRMVIYSLLFINYLNVVPVLPLDGGHVVQTLLPPRFLKGQAIFIVLTCVIGAAIAIFLEFYILAVLAVLQLLTVPSYIQSGKVVHHLLQQGSFVSPHRADRLLRVFKAYERIIGPPLNAQQRINHAEQVLHALETQPMSWVQRSIVGTVYSSLLVVPVVILVAGVWASMTYSVDADAMRERLEKDQAEYAVYQRQAEKMSSSTLFKEILKQAHYVDAAVEPVSDSTLMLAETRLGARLPDDLREIYSVANGAPNFGLLPIENIGRVGDKFEDRIIHDAGNDVLYLTILSHDGLSDKEITIQDIQYKHWLYIGDKDFERQLLFSPSTDENIQGIALIEQWAGSSYAAGYESLRYWLEYQWISMKQSQQYEQTAARLHQQAYNSLLGVDITDMLEMHQNSSLLEKLLNLTMPIPDGASDEDIRINEQRLDLTLPEDMRALYVMHNGFPPLQILALNEIAPYIVSENEIISPDPGWNRYRGEAVEVQPSDLAECLVIGGIIRKVKKNGVSESHPTLLWCPPASRISGYANPGKHLVYKTLTDVVRERTAAVETDKLMM